MRLERASTKAIKYALMNFHYAKTIPSVQSSFSVFNNKNEWCGVICYSIGANKSIGTFANLMQGQVCELVRVALNGKQESTSKALSLSIKLMAKKNPLVKIIVSYADSEQGHVGTIYKATNWYFIGVSKHIHHIHKLTGKRMHNRVYSELPKNKQSEYKNTTPFEKYKYIYPLDKSLIPLCKSLAKPYPKKQISDSSITANAPAFHAGEEGQHHPIAQNI
jgi:hypothetical protein